MAKETLSATCPTGKNIKTFRYRVFLKKNGRVWLAMPMAQRGKVATEFWLHPKDVTDYDKLADDIAHRVATEDFDKR